MQLRWAPVAAEDLFRVIEYIQQENPVAAQRIAKTIYESAGSLKSLPNKGAVWKGLVNFPCRRFLSWWFYRVREDSVENANVIHGAQKWPPKD